MSARGGSRGTRKRGAKKPVTDDRVLELVRSKGFADFKAFVAAHTVKPDGGTWTLIEMADALGVGRSAFIGYHARWIEAEQKALS
jgi:hypothetical protein